MQANKKWVGSWSTSASKGGIHIPPLIHLNNGLLFSTARIIIRPTLSGDRIRLNISNRYSKKPLNISRVTVANYVGGKADTDTPVCVTFSGKEAVTLSPGRERLSDPCDFSVTALEKIAVSFYVKAAVMRTKGLYGGDTYLSPGDCTKKEKFTPWWHLTLKSPIATLQTLPFLTRVDVLADEDAYAIVMVGDSTVTNEKPYFLAERLRKMGIDNVAVLQQAINGNRVLDDGKGIIANIFGEKLLTRFPKDVLTCPGVKKIILKEGVNDILHPRSLTTKFFTKMTSCEDITRGLGKIIATAHENDIKVYICKLTPFKGFGKLLGVINDFKWTQQSQDICDGVNKWMDSCPAEGVITADFLAKVDDPNALKDEYTADHIHYNLKAQQLFVDNIDESILR